MSMPITAMIDNDAAGKSTYNGFYAALASGSAV
jgi:hypothetical protein